MSEIVAGVTTPDPGAAAIVIVIVEPFGLAKRSPRPGALAAPGVQRGAALRLALDIGAMTSQPVTAVGLGGEQVTVALRRLLARGADRAMQIDADADALDLEMVVADFAAAVRGAQVVIAEREFRDDRFVAPMLAERIGASLVSRVRQVEQFADGELVVLRERDGRVERVSATLPVVLVPDVAVPAPRPPTVREVLAAEAAPIQSLEPSGEGKLSRPLVTVATVRRTSSVPVHETIDAGSPTETAEVLARRLCELLDEEAAS